MLKFLIWVWEKYCAAQARRKVYSETEKENRAQHCSTVLTVFNMFKKMTDVGLAHGDLSGLLVAAPERNRSSFPEILISGYFST